MGVWRFFIARNMTMHLYNILDWYIENAMAIRGVSYLIVMLFFILWGAWAVIHKLYHRAAIKLGTGLMLGSFVWIAVNRDQRIALYVTTPILVVLAIVVIAFVVRMRWSKS
jgi:hypothetical protein